MNKITILVNDFGGYPFPIQLARFLSGMGYEIVYCYCESLMTTPQAVKTIGGSSSNRGIKIIPIRLNAPFNKYSWLRRWSQEREYGHRLSDVIAKTKPTIVLSANTPLDSMSLIHHAISRCGAKHVFWLQDILGLAMKRILNQKLPLIGRFIGQSYIRREQRLLKKADQIILISEDFREVLTRWRLNLEKAVVIENWAPLEDFPLIERGNPWSSSRGFDDKLVFLYSGTLSMKHDPKILADLARHIAPRNGVVVVRSQGLGANWLVEAKLKQNIENLLIEPFGPYSETAMAFASADVLVGLLESEASEFSVPSKVLAYLCAGRPLLLSMPLQNRAAQIVFQEQAGFVVQPGRDKQFLQNADTLLSNAQTRYDMGKKARQYAEKAFIIQEISAKFDNIFKGLLVGQKPA